MRHYHVGHVDRENADECVIITLGMWTVFCVYAFFVYVTLRQLTAWLDGNGLPRVVLRA
jgi:hypothetical protein